MGKDCVHLLLALLLFCGCKGGSGMKLDVTSTAFREGDTILPANLFVGLDDRINPDPLTVDFERAKPVHAAFGNGA